MKSSSATFSERSEKASTTTTEVSGIIAQLEANRFGLIPLLLVIMTILGAVAAAYGAQNELKLMAVAISTTFVEILIIALAPVRMILIASAIALIADLYVFIF
jgi:hypothetical protein